MEKRVIKKDALAGIIKQMAERMVVYAPVRDEDNVLFTVLEEGMEPLLEFDNTKNAPKNFFFPQTEVMMRYMKTERGRELSTVEGEAAPAVLFGVRPAMRGVSSCSITSSMIRNIRTPTTSTAGKRRRSYPLPACGRPTPPVSAPPWMDTPSHPKGPISASSIWVIPILPNS